jgi:Flp pilus assembly protein CpaB
VNRRRLGTILIGGGFVLALIVAVLVWNEVSSAESLKAQMPHTRVVVAAADIPARAEIGASMVTVIAVPDNLIQAGAAQKVEDVVGKFTPDGFVKGEVINTNKIGSAAAKFSPSFQIEKGKVMYVMPVSFAGTPFSIAQVNALRAGDRVDLLYSTINLPAGLSVNQRDEALADPVPYLQTRIMLQNLHIQEIGSYAADGTLIPATGDPTKTGTAAAPDLANANIIFIVQPEEALVLKWLKDSATYYKQSNIEMVLRSPADDELADPSLVVNFNYMRQKYNLSPPPVVPVPGATTP